ncbi:heparanase [Holotrichia oblita]|uniref:Heparanase n=1 Tax=Holotrichia oblita TaxID=644536 RepID=A0ACB9T521_HOLOL|nr:heparanase [Holotrichia oblita]
MGNLQIIVLSICYFFLRINAEELVCHINGKKSLNFLSDKFLSFTIDPAILLSGVNIGYSTMQIAKHLSPAYIRLSGPSTEYLQFIENESLYDSKDPTLHFTPTMWEFLNDWFLKTGLTPIFAISGDKDESETKLNTRTIFPLLELSEKINMKSLWQIKDESFQENLTKYKEELILFKYVLNAFPNGNQNWEIIGPHLNHWIGTNSSEELMKTIDDIENITTAVIWTRSNSQVFKPPPRLPIWLEIPKSQNPITFKSAMDWAKDIGDTASLGYEVLFREPRLFEVIAETPIFWLTLFHKKFMGRNFLELKPSQVSNGDVSIYCHCFKNQNSFLRRGAITVLAVNQGNQEKTIVLKIPTISYQHTEVQSYILTSDFENSTSTYLNGEKLHINMLNNNTIPKPKIRRARTQKAVSVEVPSTSIAFFIIPDARAPICVNNEDDINLIVQEIHADQNIDFMQEIQPDINVRIKESSTSLKDLYLMMEKELEDDEEYYISTKGKHRKSDEWKGILSEKIQKIKSSDISGKRSSIVEKPDIRKRRDDIEKRKNELIQKISDKTKSFRNRLRPHETNEEEVPTENLPSNTNHTEIVSNKRIAREAKAKVGRRGKSRGRSSKKKQIVHTTPAPIKTIKGINTKPKRDINMELLEEKANEIKPKYTKKFDRGNDSRKNYYRKELSKHILQPKHLYKNEKSEEDASFDLKDLLDNIRKNVDQKSSEEQFGKPIKRGKSTKLKPAYTINTTSKPRKINLTKKLEDSAKKKTTFEDITNDSDLDYLNGDEYSDIYEEFELINSKYFDDSGELPIKTTSRIQKQSSYSPKHKQDWLNQEIILKNTDNVDEAIRDLETYLNRRNDYYDTEELGDVDFSLMDYYDAIDYIDSDTPIRYKRDENHGFTEEDIRFYKLLMSSNIRHMRESMKKQKLKGLPIKKEVKPINLGQRLHGKKPQEDVKEPPKNQQPSNEHKRKLPLKINLEQVRPISNLRLLRSRLAQQKTVEGPQKPQVPKVDAPSQAGRKVETVDEETRQLIKTIKNELRNRRTRSINLKINKRYVDKNRNRLDNDLDDTVNSIREDVNYLIPKIDDTQISLILPTKDEISFSNFKTGSEIKFKHFKKKQEEEEEGYWPTCPLNTDFDSTTETMLSNQTEKLTTTEVDYKMVPNFTNNNIDVRNDIVDGRKLDRNVTHIQKIKKNGESRYIDNFFKSITNFFDDVHNKIKSYLPFL